MRPGSPIPGPGRGIVFTTETEWRTSKCGRNRWPHWLRMVGRLCGKDCSMEYAVTAAFLLSVVAGSFAAVILGGYGIAQLIASAL